jgi:hypothetical protein
MATNDTFARGGSGSDPICQDYTTTKTKVTFRRNAGDLPAVSFYANLITGGSMYFEVR